MSIVRGLSSSEILDVAKSLKRGVRHWSKVAEVIGRIEDDALFAENDPPYTSCAAYLREELDVDRSEYLEALHLWDLIKRCPIPFEEWEQISKAKALMLRKIIRVGGDPLPWIRDAIAAKTAEAFGLLVARHLDQTPYATFSAAVPVDVSRIVESALVISLDEVLDEVDRPKTIAEAYERVQDRDVRGRCLEAIVVEYVSSRARADA